jgi:hypothetical protein
MKITLISPRIAIQKGDFLGSGIPYWPVEMAVFAAFLQQQKYTVSVIDLFGTDPTRLESHTDHYLQGAPVTAFLTTPAVSDAELIILYAMSSMSHSEILNIAGILKEIRPEVKISVLENSQAVTAYDISLLAGDFFEAGVNHLLCGEMYWNWAEIESFLSHPDHQTPPPNVLVPSLPEGHNARRQFNKQPGYPIPAWELFNLANYWSIPYAHGPKTKRFLPVLTSRGCPYPCDFCVVPATNSTRWRGRTPKEVVNELITLRDRFGVQHFQIEDLNPTVQSKRWDEICRLLIKKEAGIFFYFVSGTKAETVKLDQVSLLAQAGCRYISISPESGSLDVLKTIGKPFDYGHALALIEACHYHGIYTQACFLVGHPAEKPEDHQCSCDYLRTMVRAGLDEVAVFIVAPLAGSALQHQNKINLVSQKALRSFSPKGREDWDVLVQRRRELIRIFFSEKLKRGSQIWLQGIRALWGTPRTKMENLPLRIIYVYWLIMRHQLSRFFL